MEAERPRRRDISRRTYLEARALITLAALWSTRRALGAPLPAGADVAAHVVRTDFAFDRLLPHGRLDGWFPGFGSGYRLFAVNGPGLALASGLVRLLSLGRLDTGRSFAVLGVVALAALPWSVAALGRQLGATRVAAAAHGALALGVSTIYGGGLAGLYRTGLLAHTFALPIQVAVLAAVVRLARGPDRRVRAGAALGVAALLLLHPISLVVLAPLAALLVALVVRPRSWAALGRMLAPALGGAAVAAFWLLPTLRTSDLRGGVSAWATPPLPTRWQEVATGEVALPLLLLQAAVAALAFTAVQAVRSPVARLRLVPPAVALAYLAAFHPMVGHHIGPPELMIQLPNRGLGLMVVLALFPLAGLVGDLVLWRPALRRPLALATAAVLAVAMPLLLPEGLDPPQRPPAPSPELVATAEGLARVVPPGGRHLFVPSAIGVALGTDVPARWLALASGTDAAHLYLAEATKEPGAGLLEGQFLRTSSAAQGATTLRRFGITHVVVADPADGLSLAGDPADYREVERHGSLVIFAVQPGPRLPAVTELLQPELGLLATTATVDVQLDRYQPERFDWTTTTDRGVDLVAPVAFDPDWEVRIDGEPAPVVRRDRGLVGFRVPTGTHRVELRFTGSRNDPVGLLVTLLALGLAGWELAPDGWRRRLRPGSDADADRSATGRAEGPRTPPHRSPRGRPPRLRPVPPRTVPPSTPTRTDPDP